MKKVYVWVASNPFEIHTYEQRTTMDAVEFDVILCRAAFEWTAGKGPTPMAQSLTSLIRAIVNAERARHEFYSGDPRLQDALNEVRNFSRIA